MAGPDRPDKPEPDAGERGVPGHFVSPDLRSDCARFLDDVKSIVARRRDAKPEPLPRADSSRLNELPGKKPRKLDA